MVPQEKNDLWKPFCKTENRKLGKCMAYEKAEIILREHEKDNPSHVVDKLKC